MNILIAFFLVIILPSALTYYVIIFMMLLDGDFESKRDFKTALIPFGRVFQKAAKQLEKLK